jgi:hypothetical protein
MFILIDWYKKGVNTPYDDGGLNTLRQFFAEGNACSVNRIT